MDLGANCAESDIEFAKIVQESFSIAQILKKTNKVIAGGNYFTTKRRIKLLGLDISHFTGQGHLKGKNHNWGVKIPLSEILVVNSLYGGGTHTLKLRLLKEGLFESKCYCCGLTEWRGVSIPLELEHKNGNRTDNRIKNLTLLCPNCHALTSTYRGKNKRACGEMENTADLMLLSHN